MSPRTVAPQPNPIATFMEVTGLASLAREIIERAIEHRQPISELAGWTIKRPLTAADIKKTFGDAMSSGVDRCTLAEHDALRKNDQAWDALFWRPDWVFEDEVLEQRDCKCGSTLARPKRVVEYRGHGASLRWVTIAGAIHAIRFYKGLREGARLRGDTFTARSAYGERVHLELALLELCVKGTP
jgi:hypothetical protein